MHPIVIYQLVKTRMELDRQAERRRLAQAQTPRVQRAPASSRPPGKRWSDAISRCPRLGASSPDRGQRSRADDLALSPPAATGSPVRPGRPTRPR